MKRKNVIFNEKHAVQCTLPPNVTVLLVQTTNSILPYLESISIIILIIAAAESDQTAGKFLDLFKFIRLRS